MATQLAQTAKATRVFFFGSIALLVAYLILSQVFGLLFAYLKSLQPAKEIAATVGFGRLPKPNFRAFKLGEPAPEFELDTVTGSLPSLPRQAIVYPIVQPESSYLSLDKAKDLAKRLNFSVIPQSISSSVYFWEEEGQTLKMNIYSGNFFLDTDYTKLVIPIGDFTSLSDLEKSAVAFLSGRGLLNFGYENGRRQAVLAKIENGQILKTDNLADASLAQIDFFRSLPSAQTQPAALGSEAPPLETPTFGQGNVQLLVYVSNKSVEPLRIKYNNWEIGSDKTETYPLKPISLAWQEVVGGNSLVSLVRDRAALSLGLPSGVALTKVFIRKIYLAYFDDEDVQKYLQPIYVFEGDARDAEGKIYDFATYVQALDPAWVE